MSFKVGGLYVHRNANGDTGSIDEASYTFWGRKIRKIN